MSARTIRQMSALEIIRQALELFGSHAALLVIVAFLPQVVLLALELGLTQAFPDTPGMVMFILLLTVIMNGVALSAITGVVAGAVVGYPPTVLQAYRLTFRNNLLWVVGAYLLTALITSFGLMFFILPGLILGGYLAPTIPVIVLESLRPTEAIARSFALMREDISKGIAIFAFVIFVSGVLPLAVQLYLGVGPLSPFLGTIIGSVTLPLAYTANVVLYLSVRARDGYSVELLEQDLHARVAE